MVNRIEITHFTCPRCDKSFEDSVRGHFPGKYCKNCTEIIRAANRLEAQLNRTDFSFDKDDEEIARRIQEVLEKEESAVSVNSEDVLNHLIGRRIADEERRLKILRELRRLQAQKR